MKAHIKTISTAKLVFLVILAVLGPLIVRPAMALVDATSSPATTTPATSDAVSPEETSAPAAATTTAAMATTTTEAAATTTSPNTGNASSTTPVSSTFTPTASPTEPPPPGLTLVHIIGTKYIDYFNDGTTTITVPGDPNIDSHFAEPNAPAPTHDGMTWVHTTGGYLYDTPSSDLEVGDYAVQPDGEYIENAPPFVSSTSTPAELPAPTTTNTATDTSSSTSTVTSASVPDASSTVAATAETSTSTTNSGSTTSSTI